MIDHTRLQNLLLILEIFFWASCSQGKSPPDITDEVIFKKKNNCKVEKTGEQHMSYRWQAVQVLLVKSFVTKPES